MREHYLDIVIGDVHIIGLWQHKDYLACNIRLLIGPG